MDPGDAITIDNVSKTFRIETRGPSGRKETQDHTVLDDITLTVKKGDVVGILGRNGSGKSTLLKLISRIMKPTSGTIAVNGKVASILELGMGFHTDMTGRENIYLKGEMYGFSRKELDRRMDEIIRYSGLEKYIDNPVRTYSSGMTGRLAFAIMVNVDADVLLVDEVLSVGDTSFSAKAVDHFKSLSRKGKTVLFVSHTLPVMEQMCNRAIWIEGGKIRAEGSPRTVCAQYQNKMSESPDIVSDLAKSGVPDAQYRLALMYRDGNELPKDATLYEEWTRKASEQGHSQAQAELAELLLVKDPVSNREEAVSLFRLAATAGNQTARLRLSSLLGNENIDDERTEVLNIFRILASKGNPYDEYRYADLILKSAWTNDDRSLAFEWFVKAAEGGNADAMYQAAIMCRDGIGTSRDPKRMIEFLESAGYAGHFNALHMLVDVYTAGRLVESDDEKLFGWVSRSARIGNTRSQYLLATMYHEGKGTEKDQGKADEWFRIYSHSTIATHQMWAAEVLRNIDIGVEVSPEEMIEKAARSHNMSAKYSLMSSYRDGILEIPDKDKAYSTVDSMAEQYGINRYYLADSLYKGNICPQDKERAAELYRSCVTGGDGNSAYRLALMHLNGDGAEKDDTLGMKYLEFAVERGNKDAAVLMNRLNSRRHRI